MSGQQANSVTEPALNQQGVLARAQDRGLVIGNPFSVLGSTAGKSGAHTVYRPGRRDQQRHMILGCTCDIYRALSKPFLILVFFFLNCVFIFFKLS